MTDLERVLGFIKKREDWEEAELIVYGHLEEAKRLKEAISKLAVQRAEDGAELDRLREENEGHKEEVRRLAAASIENARLREQLDALEEDGPPPSAVQQKALLQENARLREVLRGGRAKAIEQRDRVQAQRDTLLTTLRAIERGKYDGWVFTPGGHGYRAAKRMSRKMMRERARRALARVEEEYKPLGGESPNIPAYGTGE